MEIWQVCFNNSKGLKIKAKKKDLLKTEQRFVSVKTAESGIEEDVFINLDNVIWMMRTDEKKSDSSLD